MLHASSYFTETPQQTIVLSHNRSGLEGDLIVHIVLNVQRLPSLHRSPEDHGSKLHLNLLLTHLQRKNTEHCTVA